MSNRRQIRSARLIGRHLGVSASTIYDWARNHELPAFKLRGPTSPLVAYVDELDGWVQAQRAAPIAEKAS